MICDDCMTKVDEAFELRQLTANSEKFYFGRLREKTDIKGPDFKINEKDFVIDKENFKIDKENDEKRTESLSSEKTGKAVNSKVEIQQSLEEIEIELEDVAMIEEEKAINGDENLVNDLNVFIESLGGIETVGIDEDQQAGAKGAENKENIAHVANTSLKQLKPNKLKKPPVVIIKKQQECDRKAECSICTKLFRKKYILRKHIEMVHEKKKKFACANCPMAFYQKSEFISHFMRRHVVNNDPSNSYRKFKCVVDGCGKFFKTPTELERHQGAHSG